MELNRTKCVETQRQKGSALVMVVVLTVLLAAIGTLFLMASRVDEAATSSIVTSHELDCAVESVVEMISQRLMDDLTAPGQEAFDYPGKSGPPDKGGDRWLATIEPVHSYWHPNFPHTYGEDVFWWRQLSDITGQLSNVKGLNADVYVPADANDIMHVVPSWGYPDPIFQLTKWRLVQADADGDGVTDSVWVRMPDAITNRLTTSRGEPIFVAVRIIDNCAMLNLNTAQLSGTVFKLDPLDAATWSYVPSWPASSTEGRYLSSVNLFRFLRGTDLHGDFGVDLSDPYSIIRARRAVGFMPESNRDYHNNAIMNIENPGPEYTLFDISDELEIRNRFMLTTYNEARFERDDVANFTLDAGGGRYSYLRIPVKMGNAGVFGDGTTYSHFDTWKWRVDPNNFDHLSGAYVDDPLNPAIDYRWKYDRRHVCTFYSFDRNLRTGYYPPVFDDAGNPLFMIFDPDASAVGTDFGVWDASTSQFACNNIQTREQILRLLYAFRAYFMVMNPTEDYKEAARRSVQLVANMIDYVDGDPLREGPFFNVEYDSQLSENPTFIDREIIRQLILEVSDYRSRGLNIIDIDVDTQYEFGLGIDDVRDMVYGYERQPFISEIVYRDDSIRPYYAVELCNPYDTEIPLQGWRIKIGLFESPPLDNSQDPSNYLRVPARSVVTGEPGRLVLVNADIGNPAWIVVPNMDITSGEILELQRPDPAFANDFITVDRTEEIQADDINRMGASGWRSSQRDETSWGFGDSGFYETGNADSLDSKNSATAPLLRNGWQLPVADNDEPIGTLRDFEMVLLVGNEKDPNGVMVKTVTEHVAGASSPIGESKIRNDVKPRSPGFPRPAVSVIDYVCFMSRPEGNLPGRININTATKEVIRAAIPPNLPKDPDYDQIAENIVAYRDYAAPIGPAFKRITELINVDGFDQFLSPTDPVGVGDPDIRDDLEEKHWLLSSLANIFTVRSDTFTAYILVRLGHDGPERRMIAIFDRSNVSMPTQPGQKPQKPRIVALHPVPDPR